MLAIVGAFAIPFLLSFGNILMSTMKGLHENTVSLYMNPALGIVMYIVISVQGLDNSLLWGGADKDGKSFQWIDWFLIVFFSIGTVIVQTLKFLSLQYELPGKLSHY